MSQAHPYPSPLHQFALELAGVLAEADAARVTAEWALPVLGARGCQVYAPADGDGPRLLAGAGEALDGRAAAEAAWASGRPEAVADTLAIPLCWRGQVTGMLVIGGASEPIAQAETLASLAAAALGQARLQAAATRQAERLAILHRASQAISQSLDAEQIYAATYEAAGQLMPTDAFAIALRDAEAQQMVGVFLMDRGQRRPPQRVGLESGLAGYMLRLGQPLLCHSADEWPAGVVHFGSEASVQSVLAVPMQTGDGVFGVLATEAYAPGAFSAADVPLLALLANQAASALVNARRFEVTHRRVEELTLLHEITLAAVSAATVDEIVSQTVAILHARLGCDVMGLALLDERGEHFYAHPSYRQAGGRVGPAASLPVSRGLVGLCLRTGQTVRLDEVSTHPEYVAADPDTRSELVVPLKVAQRVIGALNMEDHRPAAFGAEDERLLTIVAGVLAPIIENARLYAEARQRAAEASALMATTVAVASALDLPARLEAIAYEARALAAADSVSIYRLSADGKQLTPILALDELYAEETLNDTILVGEGLIGYVGQTGVGEVFNRADQHPRALQIAGTPLTPECMMVVPLAVGVRNIGVMAVYREGEREYTAHDFDLLSSFAAQAAAAIENAELYQALRERADSLQETYDELAEINRLKDEMVQNISHELRTPLTFLRGYVDLLLAGDLGPLTPEQQRSLAVVRDKTETLVRLVNDIITLQAVTPANIARQPLDLLLLARKAADGVAAVAVEAGIELVRELPHTPLEVRGDATRLGQVFDNLLSNAIKFTGHGGRIGLHVLPERDWVRVEVRDTGIGVAPEFRDRIFERFYQVDGTITRRRGGIGLGLAICKLIIEAHGGQIGVEDNGGQGSCFYFVLPSTAAAA